MSVANEIKTLQELLNTGALSEDEFNLAKKALLTQLSEPALALAPMLQPIEFVSHSSSSPVPLQSCLNPSDFVGRWQVRDDAVKEDINEQLEITLTADGKAILIVGGIDINNIVNNKDINYSRVKWWHPPVWLIRSTLPTILSSMKINKATGIWWIEEKSLGIRTNSRGNALWRLLTKNDKDTDHISILLDVKSVSLSGITAVDRESNLTTWLDRIGTR